MPELQERLGAAYAAGTGTELAIILQDLRVSAPQPGDLAGAAPTSVRDVGIIAGFRRTGRWMVGRTFRGLAVIGNGEIDLRQARFIDGETTIHATAIVGDITVVVPEDADVHIGGTGIIGGFDHHDEGPGTPGAPGSRSPASWCAGASMSSGVPPARRHPARKWAAPSAGSSASSGNWNAGSRASRWWAPHPLTPRGAAPARRGTGVR